MATLTLAERARMIRSLAGYGDNRRAAEFARMLGIRPSSLHDIESGKTQALGAKSLAGYLRLGASLKFLNEGLGDPMQKGEIEKKLKKDTLASMITELDENETDAVTDLVKGMIRRKGGNSPNDPFKQDPPKSGGTQ